MPHSAATRSYTCWCCSSSGRGVTTRSGRRLTFPFSSPAAAACLACSSSCTQILVMSRLSPPPVTCLASAVLCQVKPSSQTLSNQLVAGCAPVLQQLRGRLLLLPQLGPLAAACAGLPPRVHAAGHCWPACPPQPAAALPELPGLHLAGPTGSCVFVSPPFSVPMFQLLCQPGLKHMWGAARSAWTRKLHMRALTSAARYHRADLAC